MPTVNIDSAETDRGASRAKPAMQCFRSAEACEAMVTAEREWKKLEVECKVDPKADVCAYFDALETRYQTDKRLWELFTAGNRSVRSNTMYNEYRLLLLKGSSLRADA